jgi:hypothetical protein
LRSAAKQIVRAKVACDGGKIRPSSQLASKSAASTFRVQSVETEPTLFARAPIVKLSKTLPSADRTLVIARSDHTDERHAFAIDDASAAAGFFDLAKVNISLARCGIYDNSVGGHKLTFQIAAKAKSGPRARRQPPAAPGVTLSGPCRSIQFSCALRQR